MSQILLSALLILLTAILRLWHLGLIPPLGSPDALSTRYVSVIASVLCTAFLILLVRKTAESRRIGSLTAWVYAIMPWALEQGRITSPVNVFVAVLIMFLYASISHPKKIFVSLILLISVLSIPFMIPSVWIFLNPHVSDVLSRFPGNVLYLLSPNLLFLSNTTFYWGGIREFGVLLPTMSPFLMLGFIKLASLRYRKFWLGIFTVFLFAAFSPFLPESREFYFAVPFLSFIVALGIDGLFIQKGKIGRIVGAAFLIFMLYEFGQVLHYMGVHYNQDVVGHLGEIHVTY
jgi:hypothetical protein